MGDTKITSVQNMILDELRHLRKQGEETRETVIRIEERMAATTGDVQSHVDACESYRARHEEVHQDLHTDVATTKNVAAAHEREIQEIKNAREGIGKKIWEILIMVGGAFAAAWAAVKVGR